jgi:AraC-like DNA-binding protein
MSATVRAEPMLSIRLVWPFARLIAAHPEGLEILPALGLDVSELADPDMRVPHRVAFRALEEAERRLGDPTLGLRAGALSDASDFGLLDRTLAAAPNLGAAYALAARYYRIMDDASNLMLSVEDDLAIWRLRTIDDTTTPPAANDYAVMASLSFERRTVSVYEPPLEVRLAHPRPSHADVYERHFGCSVRFGAPENAIVMKKTRLEVPMLRANARMSSAFEHQLKHVYDRLSADRRATERVRQEISQQFYRGTVSMEKTARRVGMSVATLRRRLGEEGTTFSAIVDDLRHKLAERYLRATEPSVGEIAFLLGFSDVTAFARAFRRWTGVSPSEFRESSRVAPNTAS